MIDLSSKSALVTGAGRGIGKEIAMTLAKAGCDVAISDIDIETASSTAKEIEALGRKSMALKADVSNAKEVETMISSFVEKFGKIDILVNNAGITRDGLLMRMKEEDWDLVLNINLKSAFLCCKEAVRPMMKARSGKIINIASVVGLMGNAGQANYSASKAGLIGLTKTLAREFAGRAINVNAVAPGFIKTAMTDKLSDAEKLKLSSQIPMQELGSPTDVANAVLFLSSSLSDYITGQVLTVDGGLVM
ncbi:MAG TPA: 3-oxoacyl-[acyl-carrier-protein] reductase [Chitinispirillaceae bacterium]|nr:3-oxoacyl-[acyl-carrier-protein] reductase [Chitinispirillaceae bacterium]